MVSRSVLRRFNEVFIALGITSVLVLPVFASTLNGTVTVAPELSRRLEAMEKERAGELSQYYWRVPNGAVATVDYQVDPARDLLVILEPESKSGTAPAGQPRIVSLEGGALNPTVVAVTPHTKIRFRNTDAFVYELECPENSQMSNAQPLPPGQQVDYPFDEEGVFMITDRRLPHLVGWVIVSNSALSNNPQRGEKAGQASFSFSNVQPGNYKIKVFFAGNWMTEQPVEVPEDRDEVGVQISLPADGAQHEGEGESEEAEQ